MMYKEATRQRVRFNTEKGNLTVEQLWDLKVEYLDQLAVELEEEYKNSKAKSFLTKKTQKDKTAKMKFDIVLDVLNTKVEEQEQALNAEAQKEHNQKILNLIQMKKEKEMQDMSLEELEAMLK